MQDTYPCLFLQARLGTSNKGKTPSLATNIKLASKPLTMANTLAYCSPVQITYLMV